MKAFEGRLAKEFPYVRPTSVDAEIMRQEWRAALEWLYRRVEKRHTRQDIEDMILEELDDERV